MPTFLITDFDASHFKIEEKLFADAGMRLVIAQAKTEDDVIRAASECNADGLLVQYAPISIAFGRYADDIVFGLRLGYDQAHARVGEKFLFDFEMRCVEISD